MDSTPGGLPDTASTIATGPPAPADAVSIDAPENTAENRRRLICRAPKASAPYDPRDFSGVAEIRIPAHGCQRRGPHGSRSPLCQQNKHTRLFYNSKLAISRGSRVVAAGGLSSERRVLAGDAQK